MKVCIGIISYFPDKIKSERITYLERLLERINKILPDIDCIIIAQNGGQYIPSIEYNGKLTIHKYNNRLGILSARKKLRNAFINSEYDTIIHMEDDCILEGDNGTSFIEDVYNNEGKYGIFKPLDGGFGFKLLVIPKTIYRQLDIPDINVENGEGYEDKVYPNMLVIKFPDKQFEFRKLEGIDETSGTAGSRTGSDNYGKENGTNSLRLIEEYRNNQTINNIKY